MTLDLRPLTLGELFDRAFMLYRRHFRLFVGIAAVPGVFALAMTLAQQGFQAAVTPVAGVTPDAAAADSVAAAAWMLGGMLTALVLYGVAYVVALGATTFAVSELYAGKPVTIASVYGRMRGRIGALIILLVLIGIRVFGVMLLGSVVIGIAAATTPVAGTVVVVMLTLIIGATMIGALVFMALRYGLAIPSLVLEGLPARASIRRSVELTGGRLGRVFLLVVCASMVTYAAMILFQGPFLAGALLAGLETTRGFWLGIAGSVTGTIGGTLTSPFLVIGLALLYYDARVREEGLDVELALAALDGTPVPARA